jgi:hypothetical protein
MDEDQRVSIDPQGERYSERDGQGRVSGRRFSSLAAKWKALTCGVDPNSEEVPPFQFTATLEKGNNSGGGFNLGVGTCNSGELIIMGVKDGPGVEWNKANSAELELRPFDCICEVNGVEGDPRTLVEELNNAAVAQLLIRRPREFEVTIRKNGKLGRMLGLGLSSLDEGVTLTVHEVTEGGLVGSGWNRENPDRKVTRGHRVITVNGISNDSRAMLEQCSKADKLVMLLQRH